jgi:mycothiol synthase
VVRHLEILHHVDVGDLGPLHDLFRAAEQVDHRRPLSDHLWLDLLHGGREGFAGVFQWGSDRLRPIGYAQVSRAPRSWLVELVLDPEHRPDLIELGTELVEACLDQIPDDGHPVLWWVTERTEAHDHIAAANGLVARRDLLQLRRPLPLDPPTAGEEPITTRAFEPGVDDQPWLELNNRAFEGHPEQGGWDLATLDSRMEEDWFDPEGFRLHERDGRLVGFCWTKVHTETDPALGEIYVIGVDPSEHGRGLGRALTRAGFAHLAQRGITVGMLHVDAGNQAAMQLYSSLGCTVHRTDRAYELVR